MIISKTYRRNSEITIYEEKNIYFFKKRYFSKFDVKDEIIAYQNIDKFLDKNFFLPKIINYDYTNNSIVLEFIKGNNFFEEYKVSGNKIFNFNFDKILRLFDLFDKNSLKIDTDPTNLILENPSKKVFIVDPISSNLKINHYSFIVYFIGMLKCYISFPKKYFNFQFFKLLHQIYLSYLQISGVDYILLKNEIHKYLNNVIKWNIEHSKGEKVYKRISRVLFFVPFWILVKAFFSFYHYKIISKLK